MDSRRSIYSCCGAGCGRCGVVLEAARKNLLEVGAPCSHPFGGEVDLPNGPPKRYSRLVPDEEPMLIDAPAPEFIEGTSPSSVV
jgi:hypothetical protein